MRPKYQNAPGKVYLVGAGPGAADLITVRGASLLAKAQIVIHDSLVEPEMLAQCPQAIKVPVGKRCGKLSSTQKFINKRLIDAAQKYTIVVRLKGGDPMIFGRADEELQALADAGISVEVVPGITAALAGAASLQQSLTLRGVSRSVAFVTLAQAELPHAKDDDCSNPIQNPRADTFVYYMGRKDAIRIAKQLIKQGDSGAGNMPVHILEAVSTSRERHWSSTLNNLANGKANDWFDKNAPALIMVGSALNKSRTQVDNSLQDGAIFPDSVRRA